MPPNTTHAVDEPEVPDNRSLTPRQLRSRLVELALIFLRLGTIAFGGPAAHIAMMDDAVVNRRQWMSREQLLDLLGMTHLIPGPNSTELAMHIGYQRAGWRGLIVAGSCFILPAMLIVWALAAVYVRYQTIPQVQWLLYGVKPVIIAIVLQALWQLGQKAVKDRLTGVAAGCAIGAYLLGLSEIAALLLLGIAVMLLRHWTSSRRTIGAVLLPLAGAVGPTGAATTVASVSWLSVLGVFLKIGCVLYGSGYVLLAFLQRDLVDRTHWLTAQQLLDAIAIGQITPGPVFTTATFVGYLLAGNAGAIAGTVDIFLPAFGLVWLVYPWVPRLHQSPWTSSFLDGVNAASLGLMAGVTGTLVRTALVDWVTIWLALISAIAVFRLRLNALWLVLAGGLVGLFSHVIGHG